MLIVSDAPSPFAAGMHLPWAKVPRVVHEWAASIGGRDPRRVVDLAVGFSPGAIARLESEGDRVIFIKAVGEDLNAD
jgi:hypothetical protein